MSLTVLSFLAHFSRTSAPLTLVLSCTSTLAEETNWNCGAEHPEEGAFGVRNRLPREPANTTAAVSSHHEAVTLRHHGGSRTVPGRVRTNTEEEREREREEARGESGQTEWGVVSRASQTRPPHFLAPLRFPSSLHPAISFVSLWLRPRRLRRADGTFVSVFFIVPMVSPSSSTTQYSVVSSSLFISPIAPIVPSFSFALLVPPFLPRYFRLHLLRSASAISVLVDFTAPMMLPFLRSPLFQLVRDTSKKRHRLS